MALLIDLQHYFADEIPNTRISDSIQVSGKILGNKLSTNTFLAYGDVRAFYGRGPQWLLGELVENFSKSSYEQSKLGEYAVAYLCRETRSIFLAKDFTGSKGIFYAFENGKLILSTNVYDVVKQLKTRSFNTSACLEFLAFEYYAAPQTLFAQVSTLKHGTVLQLDVKTCTVKKVVYEHSLSNFAIEDGSSEWPTKLRQKIAEAHERRLGTKNGIYLSGGIDSSIMAITLKNDLGISDLCAVTFATKGAERDESADAEFVARQLSIPFNRVSVDPNADIDLMPILERSNFPYMGALILSSVGGFLKEQEFSGFNMYAGQDTRLHTPPYNYVDKFVLSTLADRKTLRKLASLLSRIILAFIKNTEFVNSKAGKGFVRLSYADNLIQYLCHFFFHLHENSSLTKAKLFEQIYLELYLSLSNRIGENNSARHILHSLVAISHDRQYYNDMSYMIGNTETFTENCSMPFYDEALNEYSATVPMHVKTKFSVGRAGHTYRTKFVNKFPIREAYRRELSKEMIYRDKAVCITNHMYLNGSLRPYVEDYFPKSRLAELGIIKELDLQHLIDKARMKSGNWGIGDYEDVVEVHNLLFLEAIARAYL